MDAQYAQIHEYDDWHNGTARSPDIHSYGNGRGSGRRPNRPWCAWLEPTLVDLCAELINGDKPGIGHAVTANMSASVTVQLAKTLVNESASISKQNKAVPPHDDRIP